MKPWGRSLAERGHAVEVPLLPGHGTLVAGPQHRRLAALVRRDVTRLREAAGRERRGRRRRPVDGRLARAAAGGRPPARGRRGRAGQPGRPHHPARREGAAGPQAGGAVDARHRQRHQEARRRGARLHPHPAAGRRLDDARGLEAAARRPGPGHRAGAVLQVDRRPRRRPLVRSTSSAATSPRGTSPSGCSARATTWRPSTTTPRPSSPSPPSSSPGSPPAYPLVEEVAQRPSRNHPLTPPSPGYRDLVSARGDDERRTREDAVWRDIVDNYGERRRGGRARAARVPRPASEPVDRSPSRSTYSRSTRSATCLLRRPRSPARRRRGPIAWAGVFGVPVILLVCLVRPLDLPLLVDYADARVVRRRLRLPRRHHVAGAARALGRRLAHLTRSPGAIVGRVSVSENVEVTGHLMDSGILSRILDDIRQYGGDWVIKDIDLGHEQHDTSHATITHHRRRRRGAAAAADAAADPRRQPDRPRRGDHRPWPTWTGCSPTASTPPPTCRPGCASRAAGTTSRTPRWTAASSSTASGVYTAADVRREGRHAGRHRRLGHPGHRARGRQGERRLRLHGVRGVLGEAPGRAGAPGRRRHARGQGRGQEGAVGRRPRRRAHRRRARDGGDGQRRASWTCSSPATRWPPTTSSRRSTAPASVSTWPWGTASSTATSTTSGPSTRSARPARSRPPSTPAC